MGEEQPAGIASLPPRLGPPLDARLMEIRSGSRASEQRLLWRTGAAFLKQPPHPQTTPVNSTPLPERPRLAGAGKTPGSARVPFPRPPRRLALTGISRRSPPGPATGSLGSPVPPPGCLARPAAPSQGRLRRSRSPTRHISRAGSTRSRRALPGPTGQRSIGSNPPAPLSAKDTARHVCPAASASCTTPDWSMRGAGRTKTAEPLAQLRRRLQTAGAEGGAGRWPGGWGGGRRG